VVWTSVVRRSNSRIVHTVEWRTFIASLVDSLAWPTAIVIIFLSVRNPVVDQIPRLRELRYRDFRVKFGERASEAAEQLPAVPSAVPVEGGRGRVPPTADVLQLLSVSPVSVVVEGWKRVEEAVSGYLDVYGIAARTPIEMSEAIRKRVPADVWKS
jgi:hypothetical protein